MKTAVYIGEAKAVEYEKPVIVMVFNEDKCELIANKDIMDDMTYASQLHAALAIHHMLSYEPELMKKVIDVFDAKVLEEAKPEVDTVQ